MLPLLLRRSVQGLSKSNVFGKAAKVAVTSSPPTLISSRRWHNSDSSSLAGPSSNSRQSATPSDATPLEQSSSEETQTYQQKTPIGTIERRLQITFTCTAPIHAVGLAASEEATQSCRHRSTHVFSKRSYEKGIVLIECPSCKNRHLIADNLSWFSSTPSHAFPEGLPIGQKNTIRTVEDLMREKGEEVQVMDGGPEGTTWTLE